jgi:hypothetical protein
MDPYHSESQIGSILEMMLAKMEEEIAKRKLIRNMPLFLIGEVGKLIDENMIAIAPEVDSKGLALTE